MNNKCLYLRFRKKQGKTYCYCTKKRAVIEFSSCYGCINKEYKKIAKNTIKIKNRTPLNKVSKTNKVTKATSIPKAVKLTVWERDQHKCIFCGKEVDWRFANSHYIKRSQLGMGIEENILTNCDKCHKLFEESTKREEMKEIAKKYLISKHPNWNEEDLVYKKWGTRNIQ